MTETPRPEGNAPDTPPGTPPGDGPAPPPSPARKARARTRARAAARHARRVAAWSAVVLAVALVALAALLATVWHSEGGLRWALGRVPALAVEGVEGSLSGGDLRIAHLHLAAGALQLDIERARLQGLRLHWRPGHGLWVAAHADHLSAQGATLAWRPTTPSGQRAGPPASLRSVATLDIPDFRVGTLSVAGLAPFTNVSAGLALGGDDGARYRVDALAFDWERVHAQAQAQLDADAPLRLEAHVAAHGTATTDAADLPWTATATLQGPLAGLDATLALRGVARGDHPAAQIDASARVLPFAGFPLADVALRTQAFDLAALSARAPTTRLDGTVTLASTQPVAAVVDLRNTAPGRWDEGAVPVATLAGRLEAPWSADPITVPALQVGLADARGAAGRLTGTARWAGGTALVRLALADVTLARLDGRLAAMTVGGTLALDADGLPSPGAAHAAATPAPPPAAAPGVHVLPAGASAPRIPSAPTAASAVAAALQVAPWRVHVVADVRGPQATLALDARLRANDLTVTRAELAAGAARVTLQGAFQRDADASWHGGAQAAVAAFDPATWWRGSTPATGRTTLNGHVDLQLDRLPLPFTPVDLRARASATLTGSQLGGAALEGHAQFVAAAPLWQSSGDLHSGANTVQWQASAATTAGGPADRLELTVNAPTVADLAPLAALAPSGAKAWPTRGQVRAWLSATGTHLVATGLGRADASQRGGPIAAASPPRGGAADPWATLALDAHGDATDLAAPAFTLGRAQFQLRGGGAPDAALAGQLDLRDARFGSGHVEAASATLSGTAANHQLRLVATAPLQPPPWLAQMANLPAGGRTRLDASLSGRWSPATGSEPATLAPLAGAPVPSAGATRWLAHLDGLTLRAAGSAAAAPPPAVAAIASAPASAETLAPPPPPPPGAAPPWLDVHPMDLALMLEPGGGGSTSISSSSSGRSSSGTATSARGARTLRFSAGQMSLAGLQVTWQPGGWSSGAAGERWRFQGAVSPFAVAPLLARAQPDLGWHGDLSVAADWTLAFDGQWHVAARVARAAGDLAVAEDLQNAGAPGQGLGLTAGSLQVRGEAGHWQLDAEVAGSHVGALSAHVTAQAPADALPSAASPLSGQVRADVGDLGAWGAWLPPGWRLGGAMRGEVALSGRLGAPDLAGTLTASKLVVRNALEGIYGHDGELAIRLAGDRATVEKLVLQAGSGTLSATGQATLGSTPQATIDLVAQQFQLLGRIDRRLVTTGTAHVALGADALAVDGKLKIDEALFDLSHGNAPTLDGDVQVTGASADADAAAGATGGGGTGAAARPARATRIRLAVDLGDKLQLRGRGVETKLRGVLQMSAPGGHLSVRGQVNAYDGQYTAYGQKLDIQRGQVTFTGPLDDPQLDIRAIRRNIDLVVGVAITGTALQPHVRLFSEPEMADVDKLSWLMLGRAPETLGRADTALLQSAALALFAGENESLSDTLLHRLGLTDFAVRQDTTGEVHDTIVSLGRQLSRRWYVGYERSVNTATGTWQLVYRIAQRVTVRAQTGTDTTGPFNALDVIWTWRWE